MCGLFLYPSLLLNSLSGYRVNHCVDGVAPYLWRKTRAFLGDVDVCAHGWPFWNEGPVPNVMAPPPTFFCATAGVDHGGG